MDVRKRHTWLAIIGRRHNFIAISCLIEVDSDYHQVNVSSLNAEVGLYEHECLYISHSQWNFLILIKLNDA